MRARELRLWVGFVGAVSALGACSSDDGSGPPGTGVGAAGAGAQAGAGAAPGGGGQGGDSGETCNGEDDDGDGLVDEGLEDFCGPCGRGYDREVVVDYPIYATWMFARSDPCDWQIALEAFHRQGGQAVWQFGPHFGVHTAEALRSHPEFASCVQDGQHCVDAALADLVAANPANTVANWLTYEFRENYSDVILSCPALDRKTVVGDRTFWRLVLPHQAGQAPCNFDGGSFDVLLVWFEGVDSPTELLRVADGMQMTGYLGMPSAPPLAAQPWNVDVALRPAFLDWARRVLEDYAARHGDHASFAGVYQSFEVSLQSTGLNAVYETYGLVSDVVRATLPGRAYVLSPYWDVHTSQGDHSVASVKEGFKRLARQDVDIIAPQDGRGTGKSALYWPFQSTETIASIDPKLASFANVDGTSTFGQQFNAATWQLYDAVRAAVPELAAEGVSVELWANLEAFENLSAAPCGYGWALERTDKPRLDWALTMGGAQPTRIISFMWDAYYWCLDGGYAEALATEILADGARPILSQADLETGQMMVRGYNLSPGGTQFHLTWYDSAWAVQSATVAPTAVESNWGVAQGRMPQLEQATVPFDSSNLAPSFYVHIGASGPTGDRAHHDYSLAY